MDYKTNDITEAAELVGRTALSLFNAIKCVYAVSADDFYNINVKDVFKVSLSDVSNPAALSNMGISFDREKFGVMESENFSQVLGILHYSLGIRLPFMRRYAPDDHPINSQLRDSHIKDMWTYCHRNGAANNGGVIEEDFKSMTRLFKTKMPEPPVTTDWFRRFIYTTAAAESPRSAFGELTAINNRNMFLFGSFDTMYTLYYSALVEMLLQKLGK